MILGGGQPQISGFGVNVSRGALVAALALLVASVVGEKPQSERYSYDVATYYIVNVLRRYGRE